MTDKNGVSASANELLEWIDSRKKGFGPLVIVTHDHPDPDALASGWALSHLMHLQKKARARVVFGGIIGRRENRIMFHSLEVPAFPIRPNDLDAPNTALVDTQPPFKNNVFPVRRKPDLIIDHHPLNSRTQAGLALIDESVGATSTILAEALFAAGGRIPTRLATALVYGIGSETQNLGRDAQRRDSEAYVKLLPKANLKALWRIANPPRSANFFHMLARAIRDAFVCRWVIGVHLREIANPDRVAMMADFLLTHEHMTWSAVTGRYDDLLHISLRTTSPSADAGRLLKEVLGGKNRGGGHRMIAGGQLKVGKRAPEAKWKEAEERVISGLLRKLSIPASAKRNFPYRDAA